MKIAYIYSTLAATGGTERMITEKVNYYSERFGYDVTIITCFQCDDEANFFPISSKVKQINLGIPYYTQYKYKYPKRLWIKWRFNRLLKNSLKRAINQVNPDILIGVSRFKANIISKIKCNAIKTIECHEVRYNTILNVAEDQAYLIRVYMKIYEYFYLKTIEHHADAVITLTEEDKLLWRRAKRTEAIPNFSTMHIRKYSDCTSKRVIAIGRLSWEKGFGRLIEIWSYVSSKHPDWQLDIFGEGGMYNTLKMLIKLYKAQNVVIHNYTSDISLEYASSSICAVTSYFEGFSLVLLEAMKHGVPCVAFDCPFGPRSLINDSYNGFLVENGETRIFADRLCRLIENEELRKYYSKSSIEKSKTFDVDVIMNKWRSFYEQLLGK
jgi:glycosyltransferase involved in cell wall biosynthesis